MVWLAGAEGMLGKHIAEKLNAAGISFIATDLDVDITSDSAVYNFTGKNNFKWIINCSAYTAVDMAEDEKDKAFAVNADGAKNLAGAAKACGAKLVHFSTDYVFPGLEEKGYMEEDETGPVSVYGKSKLAGEKLLASSSANYFIFRISWLYGPYGKNFVDTILNLFDQKDELNVVSDQYGSPTYTGELAEFIVKLIQEGSDKYGVYHFSGEGMTNWFEFASEIYRLALKFGITNRKININPVGSSMYPQKAKRPEYSYMLKDKLFNTFGFRPGKWESTLDEYIKSVK